MLHPTLQQLSDAARAAGQPPLRTLTPTAARARVAALRRASEPAAARVVVRDDLMAGVRVREYVPVGGATDLTVVYAHSGGWVLGDLDAPDPMLRRLAEASACRYISVDYRLAPEHPYPAALEDVEAVVQACPSRVVVHGDSAGGNLAAVLAQRHPERIAGQILVYPVTDCDLTRRSYGEPAAPGFLDPADMEWFWDLYVPEPADRRAQGCSPLRHVSAVNPPALVITAQYDPLRDEGLAYVEALRRSGASVTHRHLADCTHGFMGMVGVLEPADQACAAIGKWLRHLSRTSSRS